MTTSTGSRLVRRAGDVPVSGPPELLDRFLVESGDSGGAVTLIEHQLDPGVLAAPLHRHSREDEISLVLSGRMGVLSDGETVYASAGDVVFKPRGHWHTFWNAGDDQLRLLELITPGGLEGLFRRLSDPGADYDPETLPALAASYGCEVDFAATVPLAERHGLRF